MLFNYFRSYWTRRAVQDVIYLTSASYIFASFSALLDSCPDQSFFLNTSGVKRNLLK